MKIFDSEGFKYDSVNGCVVFESAVGTTSWVYTAIGYKTLWLVWVCVTWSRNLEMDVFVSNFKTFGKVIFKNRYVQTACHPAIVGTMPTVY